MKVGSWMVSAVLWTGGLVLGADPQKETSSAFEALAGIPEGVESRGVVKSSFSGGVLSSLIEAATVTKVAEDRLEMKDMRLRIKGDTEPEDVEVLLSSAGYDLGNQMLSSEERSRVRRSDFTIEGDSLVFDTQKSVGRMNGNVIMVINLSKPGGSAPEPAPENTAKPSKQP